MLNDGSLASHSSQHVGRHSSVLSHLTVDVLAGQVLKGVPYLYLAPDYSEMCVVQTGVLFLILSGSGGGNLSIYNKGLPAMLEGMGRLVC